MMLAAARAGACFLPDLPPDALWGKQPPAAEEEWIQADFLVITKGAQHEDTVH